MILSECLQSLFHRSANLLCKLLAHKKLQKGGKREKEKKTIFHTQNQDAKILLSVSEILVLVVHRDFREFARIISPKTDSMLSSCFSTTFRRLVGFLIVQWWGARQSDPLVERTVSGGAGSHQSTTAINSTSQRTKAGEQQALFLKPNSSMSMSSLLAQMHSFQLAYLLLIIIKFIYLSVLCIDRHIVSHQGLNI